MGEHRANDDGHAYRKHKETGHDKYQREGHCHAKHNERDAGYDDTRMLKYVNAGVPEISTHGHSLSISRAKLSG
jgi:hypothetical protein